MRANGRDVDKDRPAPPEKRRYYFNEDTRVYVTPVPGARGIILTTEAEHKQILLRYSRFLTDKCSSINELARDLAWSRPDLIAYLRAHEITHDREPWSPEEMAAREPGEIAQDATELRRQRIVWEVQTREWDEIRADARKWREWEASVLRRLQEATAAGQIGGPVPRVSVRAARAPYLLVVGAADVHYGKHGRDYDRKQARDILFATTQELLADACGAWGRPDLILWANVGDWSHVDYDTGTTRAGTPQDCDGTFTDEILPGACDLAVAHIDLLRQVAPVRAVNVPGNHDPTAAVTLGLYLQAAYRATRGVTVEPHAARQYVRYHANLLGFTHKARTPKGVTLGQLMATERPEDWAESRHRVWFCGDLHHRITEDQMGVEVHTLQTIAGSDRWHRDSGYVGAKRALPGAVVDRERGIRRHLIVPVEV